MKIRQRGAKQKDVKRGFINEREIHFKMGSSFRGDWNGYWNGEYLAFSTRGCTKRRSGISCATWFLFLFLWSIPLLIIELGIGKKTRMGTIGAFGSMKRGFTWMGGFVGFCALAITFYYSVVTGWCFRYALASLIDLVIPASNFPGGGLRGAETTEFWNSFSGSSLAVIFHLTGILFASAIIVRGVANGIEKANKILIPSLFVLLLIAAVRAVTLKGATEGLNFLFEPHWKQLLNYRIWLEGLSQSAWSTGAGWGLLLTYAVYMRK